MNAKEWIRAEIRRRSRALPVRNRELIAGLRIATGLTVTERYVKKIIEQLRDEGDPVLASRRRPCGYYWCSSPEELDEFARVITAQAKSELATVAKMRRKYFPGYAEQGALEFA